MPLNVELVEAGVTSSGEPTICCAHCHKPADRSQTVSGPNDALTVELTCPEGKITLGTWPNEQQRSGDIRTFLNRIPKRKV